MQVQTAEHTQIGEELVSGVLDNGLRTFVLPKRGFNKKFAVFSTHYGSIDNHFRLPGSQKPVQVPDGIAHFLEHKLFEEEDGNIFDVFAELGASANAFTTFNMTSYLFSCTDNFTESLDVLLDYVQRPYFTDENVKKEQGIIEQEIRMYEDHPHHRVLFNLMEALYYEHPVRIDIAGSVESIRKIDRDLLYLCHETFYHPSNMALFVVGDVDPQAVMEQVAQDMLPREYSYRPPVERFYGHEPTGVREAQVVAELSLSRPRLLMGVKESRTGVTGRELLRQDLCTNLVLSAALGRSSRLYNELYEEQLIDDGFSARYMVTPTFGFSLIGGETKDPETLHERLQAGLADVRRNGVSAEDIERIRRHAIGEFLQMFNSLEFIANGFLHYHFMDCSLLDYLGVLEEIKPQDVVERAAEHLDLQAGAVSILRPHGQ